MCFSLVLCVNCSEGGAGSACEMVVPTKFERAHEFSFVAVTAEPRAVESFSENDLVLVAREKVRGLPAGVHRWYHCCAPQGTTGLIREEG